MDAQLTLRDEFREHQATAYDQTVYIEPSYGHGAPYTFYGPIFQVESVVKAWLTIDPAVSIIYPGHIRCETCFKDLGWHGGAPFCRKHFIEEYGRSPEEENSSAWVNQVI